MRRRKGFTVIELLVVIGIISVLVSILLPALSKARFEAAKINCASNLRQVVACAMLYANDNNGRFPYDLQGGVTDIAEAGGPDDRPLWQPYVKDPSIFYCPGTLESEGIPTNPNDTSLLVGGAGSAGWNVPPVSTSNPPTDNSSIAAQLGYDLFAPANSYYTTPYTRVHLLIAGSAPITDAPVADPNSYPALGLGIDQPDSSETPFAADVVKTIVTTAGVFTGYPSSLVASQKAPFYLLGRDSFVTGLATGVSAHFPSSGFQGMNVAFYDGHVEWRAKGVCGPRLNLCWDGGNSIEYLYWF